MEYIDGIPMALITGNDPNLKYVDTLGEGGYGKVYKVFRLVWRCLIFF